MQVKRWFATDIHTKWGKSLGPTRGEKTGILSSENIEDNKKTQYLKIGEKVSFYIIASGAIYEEYKNRKMSHQHFWRENSN